jgi:hypothetical protein
MASQPQVIRRRRRRRAARLVTAAPPASDWRAEGRSPPIGHNAPPDLADDLLWGCGPIAKHIKRSVRATFHLLQAGRLDAEKIGGNWVSTKSRLNAQFQGSRRASS